MMLERADGKRSTIARPRAAARSRFLAVMRGRAENDGYNALVLEAGLPWRDVALIRTLSRYLRQIGVPYSQDYMWATLRKHIADRRRASSRCSTPASIPASRSARSAGAARRRFLPRDRGRALQQVDSLDEDRILRRFVNVVEAAVRTNFYQIDAERPARRR